MKVGYPNHPRLDILQEIDWIAAQGFDFVDLFLEPDHGEKYPVDPEAIRDALSRHRLDSVGHLAWYLPIGSPLHELRDGAAAAARRYMEYFARIGARCVTVHAHWPPSMFTTDEAISWQTATLQPLIAWAGREGMTLQYEPVGDAREDRGTLEKLFAANPGLGFHLDIGHFNLNGRNPGDFAEAFSKRLTHVHLHDNDGNRDLHLPMGAGKIDWNAFIPRLKAVYDGTVTIEVFSIDRDYVLLSKRRFLERWQAAR